MASALNLVLVYILVQQSQLIYKTPENPTPKAEELKKIPVAEAHCLCVETLEIPTSVGVVSLCRQNVIRWKLACIDHKKMGGRDSFKKRLEIITL